MIFFVENLKSLKGRSSLVSTISARIKKRFQGSRTKKEKDGRSVKAMFYKCSAFIIEKGNKEIMEVILLIRKDDDGTIRYSLINDSRKSLERLSYMQGQRYFIERFFQEAKQQLGMNN
jgi:hypothetical protein